MIIVPSLTFAAGSETSSSSDGGVKSDKSNYAKSSLGRFRDAKNLINQERFSDAYNLLASLAVKTKDEADRQNLLGFTARKHGNLENAAKHYNRALEINPSHKGALEYQGELFLMLGETEKAENNLRLLKSQCWLGCSELSKLEAAIANYSTE